MASITTWKKIRKRQNYKEGYVDISMLTYVGKNMTEYDYKPTNSLKYCPYEPTPKIYSKHLDSSVHESGSPLADKHKKKYVQ